MTRYTLFSGCPSRPRSRLGFCTFALAVIAVSMLMLLDATARAGGRSCRAQCRQQCHRNCRSLKADCPQPALQCVADEMNRRQDCRDTANTGFDTCLADRCFPVADAAPGRCTLIQECVDRCRANQQSQLAGCDKRFSAGIHDKDNCDGGAACLAAERTTRRGCDRQCRPECVANCRAAPVRTTLAPQAPVSAQPLVNTCNCQPNCINGIVSACYSSCVDRCDGDTNALVVCKRGCRDQKCDRLTKSCTDDGTGTNAYALCCRQCDNCDTALGDNTDPRDRFTCEQLVTTTTIRPTTTTTTTTSSTTTTL